MAQSSLPQINTDTILNNFQTHLGDDLNERILFSAPFGAGKSTFLKDFFENHPEYITLKLYPINYSISPNEDVFELIKYDLLYELLSNYPDEVKLKQEQYSLLLTAQMFVLHKLKIDLPLKLLLKAASIITGTKVASDEPVDLIADALKKFSDYRAEVGVNEKSLIYNYINSFKNKKGHAFESDGITELIIKMIEDVRIAKSKQDDNVDYKTVLLIDDLDRLDPEHVFRLFNVFSAHYDDVTENNKFGFDKIIFVCDVNNISHMFHHKYGLHVDFTGYIDKYYSSMVFTFDMVRYLKDSLRSILEKKQQLLKFYNENDIDSSFLDRYDVNKYDGFYPILNFLLSDMIDLNIIRIRNFHRLKYYSLPKLKFQTMWGAKPFVFYPLLVLVENLGRLFPRPSDLLQAFKLLYENYPSNYDTRKPGNRGEYNDQANLIIQFSLQFIIEEKMAFGGEFQAEKQYSIPYTNEKELPIYVVFTMHKHFSYGYSWINYDKCTLSDIITKNSNDNPSILNPNPYWFLYNAYKNCITYKYLQPVQ